MKSVVLQQKKRTGRIVEFKAFKVLLDNTNLSYIFGENANIGSARETFFVNQLNVVQIKDFSNRFVVSDDLEVGHKNKIPLWLFGMMY